MEFQKPLFYLFIYFFGPWPCYEYLHMQSVACILFLCFNLYLIINLIFYFFFAIVYLFTLEHTCNRVWGYKSINLLFPHCFFSFEFNIYSI